MITEKERNAINIVTNLLDRRSKWLKENEPTATKEIENNWNASAQILELEHLDLSE